MSEEKDLYRQPPLIIKAFFENVYKEINGLMADPFYAINIAKMLLETHPDLEVVHLIEKQDDHRETLVIVTKDEVKTLKESETKIFYGNGIWK